MNTHVQHRGAEMPCCAQLFPNIENLQNIEFGIDLQGFNNTK